MPLPSSKRSLWATGAAAALVVAVVLEVVGAWSAGIELLVVAVVLGVIAWRTPAGA
ncbi:MAG TPA: hypothetical protein VGM93_15945 [Acidimicrobiales bacterium]|jgi:hypothetical protein